MDGLDRFKTAQDAEASGFADALREMRAGRKTGHWIWYVFPQLAGLGSSSMAKRYALQDASEAEAYLRDPLLGERLLAIAEEVRRHVTRRPSVPIATLMGSPVDALKLVSSMTLFVRVATALAATESDIRYERFAVTARSILQAARAQGFAPCALTDARLSAIGYA